MRKALIGVLLLFSLTTSSQSLQELYQDGLKAHDQEDFESFRDKMYQINELRPNYPAVVYNLACGYALTGMYEKAFDRLKQFLLLDATEDFRRDKDLAVLQEMDEFDNLEWMQSELKKEIRVTEKLEWKILNSHPESITYSKRQKAFYIGCVRDGLIWKIDKEGLPSIFVTPSENSWAVMGLHMAPDERSIWASTTSMLQYENFEQKKEGHASVLEYDSRTGKILRSITLPGGHNFGDLVVDRKGDVYISDGIDNKIYRIGENAETLEEFIDLSEEAFNLQGLTLNEEQNVIYVSDYIDGIYKIDLESKNFSKVTLKEENTVLKGIDGLYLENNTLIALHNGTKPNRIVRYTLSESGSEIVSRETIVQSGILGEPTQGVFVNKDFYFISNSPWMKYDEEGNFSPEGDTIIIGIIK